MTAALELIVRYQYYILGGLSLAALFFAARLVRARGHLTATPFGLEREEALRRQNGALVVLSLLVGVAVVIYLAERLILPELTGPRQTPTPQFTPTPSPSPVAAANDLVVDSSGCENPNATLTAPQPDERIAGAFEVRGTADIPNFAFYKFEISGASTGGEWLALGVGTTPVVDDFLGRFDASARESGHYAFRLVVLDSAGNSPPPCVVAVTLVSPDLPSPD
ncbi:MAG: hypothetical protein IT318_14800 [Anaerolineales bacterium]|nr:hypothetical protein [Anaerolineales bacterium]